jgi:hypothetical protein
MPCRGCHLKQHFQNPTAPSLPLLPLQGDALGRGQLHLHPAWLQLVTEDGHLIYMHRLRPHVISDCFYPAPVGGTCGGFL